MEAPQIVMDNDLIAVECQRLLIRFDRGIESASAMVGEAQMVPGLCVSWQKSGGVLELLDGEWIFAFANEPFAVEQGVRSGRGASREQGRDEERQGQRRARSGLFFRGQHLTRW